MKLAGKRDEQVAPTVSCCSSGVTMTKSKKTQVWQQLKITAAACRDETKENSKQNDERK